MLRRRTATVSALGAVLTALAAFCAPAAPAAATTIRYELVDLGANQFRAIYSVANDGSLGGSLWGFDIFFAPELYLESSLQIATQLPLAADWDELVLASGVLVPAAYDALGLSGGILDGGSVSGFAVEFTWLGSGAPGAQPFQVFDPDTFAVLESGTTTPVPEPSEFLLVMLGAVFLVGRARAARCR